MLTGRTRSLEEPAALLQVVSAPQGQPVKVGTCHVEKHLKLGVRQMALGGDRRGGGGSAEGRVSSCQRCQTSDGICHRAAVISVTAITQSRH